MLAVALLVGASCWCAIEFARPAGGVTIIWVAGGLLAGILLTSPQRLWPLIIATSLAANLLARFISGDDALMVASRGLASTFEGCLVAWLLHRRAGDVTVPAKLPIVAQTATFGTLLACAMAALVVAATKAAPGSAAFNSTFTSWFASHSLGMIIFATLFVVARSQRSFLFGRRGRRWRFLRSIGLLAVTTVGVFAQTRYPFLFLIYPPLIFVVFRHRFSGLVIGTTLIAIISTVATRLGSGPLYLIADASLEQRVLILQLFIATACLSAFPVAVMLAERGRLAASLRLSEYNYRLLADNSRDLVVRIRADGHRLYVSPSSKDMLGWEPHELQEPRWELVHPDDRAMLAATLATLLSTGEATVVAYRVRHKKGHHVWIEASARRVQVAPGETSFEIVYSGRDISRRKQAEQALAASERRLRTITDAMPAMVSYVNSEEKYTFVNAYAGRVFELSPDSALGRTMLDVRGPHVYESIAAHVAAALRGDDVTFESEREMDGESRYFLSKFVPDVAEDGEISGFYAVAFDVSELKHAQRELLRMAQHDSLTGLGNRNKFNERLALALAKCQRNHRPIALICLDIDHFKLVNDQFGHAVGDALLCEFAVRLRGSVRGTDLPARLGGDEFAVIVEDVDSPEVPRIISEKLLEAMRSVFRLQSAELHVTTSIGVGFCRTAPSADSLILFADKALYEAKAAGRNTFRVAEVG
jgi:diguanylate cyclase (GGDEF)-like protein/PAS domain S-box-containing protein